MRIIGLEKGQQAIEGRGGDKSIYWSINTNTARNIGNIAKRTHRLLKRIRFTSQLQQMGFHTHKYSV